MSLNAEARSSVAQRGEKDDGRSLQLRISTDFACQFDSVSLWHHYVQQDQVRPEIVGTLMSLGSVVLFEYKVAAGFFEQDFEQVSTVPVVINNQDASLFFHLRPPIEGFVHRSPCGGVPSPNRISAPGLQRRSRPTRGYLPGASERENGTSRTRPRYGPRLALQTRSVHIETAH